MKGGNGVRQRRTELRIRRQANVANDTSFWFAFGELRNSAPFGRFITAFHFPNAYLTFLLFFGLIRFERVIQSLDSGVN